jgi:hypothetical protein
MAVSTSSTAQFIKFIHNNIIVSSIYNAAHFFIICNRPHISQFAPLGIAKLTRYPHYTVGLMTTGESARQFLAPQTPNII